MVAIANERPLVNLLGSGAPSVARNGSQEACGTVLESSALALRDEPIRILMPLACEDRCLIA